MIFVIFHWDTKEAQGKGGTKIVEVLVVMRYDDDQKNVENWHNCDLNLMTSEKPPVTS